MRARPNLSGDQLVQDYLTRVAGAARHLPKGARIAFVGRTKAQIDREIGAEGTADPGRVAEILAALGDPDELVRAERLRIDSKWLKNQGRDGESAVARSRSIWALTRPTKAIRGPLGSRRAAWLNRVR